MVRCVLLLAAGTTKVKQFRFFGDTPSDSKHLKVDCGFGLDHSKSSDALLLRCSDAEGGQHRAALTDRVLSVDKIDCIMISL